MPTDLPTSSAPLPVSRLFTFIDGPREFALYFLEGQRLIQDLAVLHPFGSTGFAYFRDAVLSVQPMVALLHNGEQFGFYIDSDDPYFRLKIETGHQGATRSMLIPADIKQSPRTMRGLVRLLKLFPNKRPPYESIVKVDGVPLREIVNHLLRDSYQTHSAIIVSETSDQSVLLHQLPPLPGKEEYVFSLEALRARRGQIQESISSIFSRALHGPGAIEQAFGAIGFRLIATRTIRFRCSCSKGRMIGNLVPIYRQEGDGLFAPGRDYLLVTCEYCKSEYRIERGELDAPAPRPN